MAMSFLASLKFSHVSAASFSSMMSSRVLFEVVMSLAYRICLVGMVRGIRPPKLELGSGGFHRGSLQAAMLKEKISERGLIGPEQPSAD